MAASNTQRHGDLFGIPKSGGHDLTCIFVCPTSKARQSVLDPECEEAHSCAYCAAE